MKIVQPLATAVERNDGVSCAHETSTARRVGVPLCRLVCARAPRGAATTSRTGARPRHDRPARRRRQSAGRGVLLEVSSTPQHPRLGRIYATGLVGTDLHDGASCRRSSPISSSTISPRTFPSSQGRRPIVIPGPANATFKEWNLRTLGSRPHDPLATPDGAIWYTGMFANVLGRIDPATGRIKEYPARYAAVGAARAGGRQGRAGSGSRRTRRATSAGSIPRRAESRNTSCRRARAIRTRRCSIATACCGSRSRGRT